jgi:hypothetical protein
MIERHRAFEDSAEKGEAISEGRVYGDFRLDLRAGLAVQLVLRAAVSRLATDSSLGVPTAPGTAIA